MVSCIKGPIIRRLVCGVVGVYKPQLTAAMSVMLYAQPVGEH